MEDPTVQLDHTDKIYYVDPAGEHDHEDDGHSAEEGAADDEGEPQVAQGAPYALDQTFLLHSRPSAPAVIFIDLDGARVAGTAWNSKIPDGDHRGYSLDGDYSTFNDAERTAIQEIWARVAEDYAPFNVDVTTQDPLGSKPGTKALVADSQSAANALCGGGCGGVAYLKVFGSGGTRFQPAWIFPQNLAGGDPKSVAEAVSHEVGHNFGLDHDGYASYGYYSGHGVWAPIMGAGYDRPVTQWSRGEYAGATTGQDDLAIIAGSVPLVADEAGDTPGTASTNLAGTKLITSASDRDVYALGTCNGTFSVFALPPPTAALGPNLDVRLDLLDSAGNVAGSADPPVTMLSRTTARGLSAGLTVPLPSAGPWFVRVDGTGVGTPSDGYSDYASIGSYTLSVTCTPPGGTPPAFPEADSGSVTPGGTSGTKPSAPSKVKARSGKPGGKATASVSWKAPQGGGITGYRVVVMKGPKGSRAMGSPITTAARAKSYVATLRPGRYRFAIAAINAAGMSSPVASKTVIAR
nr:zinc-dependent metalloprotease family protein [Nocardioides flavescens]